MTQISDYQILDAGGTSLVLSCAVGKRPVLLYWGPSLHASDPALLAQIATRQHAHGGPAHEIAASLMNDMGSGFPGPVGFAAHRSGKDWANLFLVQKVERPTPGAIEIICRDDEHGIAMKHHIRLAEASGVLECRTEVVNEGADDLTIDWCAALCLPLDPRLTRLKNFTGRWAMEFQTEEVSLFTGSYVRENKKGRTSHDCFPGLIAHSDDASEQSGMCAGFHLGWSGNARLRADRLSDGRAFVQMGEFFYPGERVLTPGERYETPPLYAAITHNGLGALSRAFHTHVRESVMDGRAKQKPRPIHFNSWEAVYFNHDQVKLFRLAEMASEMGAERFMLDDGWFSSRRDDTSGLGDWWPSPDIYPDGLGPLIAHIQALGMEFGLWVEPEMVNPDSDLYRAHPDWVLRVEGVEQIVSRHQLVLDLTRPQVTDYLFHQLDWLLSNHDIAYLKWDMNRDIHHPGSGGWSVASAQTRALYRLMDRVRQAHPALEIEACASGGGRADYGILRYADRLWTSDSNDALDRRAIQRGASHFFPPEVLGTHVGPAICHTTGRRLTMDMRVATAFFGHMGMELNLMAEAPEDLETLKAGIALHKRHRTLLHAGNFYRLDTAASVDAIGVVAQDRSEALFSWCTLASHVQSLPGRLFAVGLDPALTYRVQIIWPVDFASETAPSIIEAADLTGQGLLVAGNILMSAGLQMPLMLPENCVIFHLVAARPPAKKDA